MARLKYVANFDRLGMRDIEQVGGKNASLGEMIGQLSQAGIRVPAGFATTAEAFREFLGQGGLGARIEGRLKGLDAEDLPDASFAGQQETFLNIRGLPNVTTALRNVFASLYNDRAISYRCHKGFGPSPVALSAGVQRMVRSTPAESATGE